MGLTTGRILGFALANYWTAGAVVPAVCGSDGATSCDLADAPAALLPNGNILFAASAGYGGNPTHFFEYGADNTITTTRSCA